MPKKSHIERKFYIERDAMDRLAVTYMRLDRRNQGHLGWGPVWTLFDRRKLLHWVIAFYVMIRDGHGVRNARRRPTVIHRTDA